MKFLPIVFKRPNNENIQAPSEIRPPVEIPEQEFVEKYADKGRAYDVSLEEDGVSNPQKITGYTMPVKYRNKGKEVVLPERCIAAPQGDMGGWSG